MIVFLILGVGCAILAGTFCLATSLYAFAKGIRVAGTGQDPGPYGMVGAGYMSLAGLLYLAAYYACA